jgi:ribonuclease HII
VDEKNTVEQAIAISGTKVLAVGSNEEILALAGEGTRVIDAKGASVIPGVNDSKKVAEKKREKLYEQLMEAAEYVRTGWKTPREIDEMNILRATKAAMEEAAAGAQGAHFLVDAVDGLALPGEATAIIHGDAISYMIAAASIIAKVTRDRYMIELDEKYPQYGFARNKGYGTAEHIAALKEYGPCPEHRQSFIQGILSGR